MHDNMPTVAVSLPMFTMKSQSVLSLVRMLFTSPGINFQMNILEGPYIQSNRSQLAMMSLANKADYLFFMDHDVSFPDDTLLRLISRDKDIVFGPYNNRYPTKQRSMVTGLDGEIVEALPSDMFECAIGPTGCMLIKTEVFPRVTLPWFHVILEPSGKVAISEDAWFCRQAREAGFSIWCDPTIKVEHYGEAIY